MGFLSTLRFILCYFCPMALLSNVAFLCSPTWSHDENVDCPPLYHVIMGTYTLIVGVLKYFLFLMVLSALSFILCCFCPMALLSIFAFLCSPTWSHDENVDCPRLYHVIMGSYTLIVGVLKYFLFLGVLSALSFILWGFCPMAHLSIFAFLCPKNVIAWRECWLSTPVSYDHVIVHLDCWSIKIFSLFGAFVNFEIYPLLLLSYGVFVHFCFSLSTHVIAWWECWLSTTVSCDHGIVHLDCWSIKILSLLWDFVHFEFYPLGLLSYGAFVNFCFSL